MPVKVPTIDDLESLVAPLAHIFSQTQASTANHRKNIVHLRKIQDACAQVTTPRSKGGPPRLTGEKAFVEAFCACLERVLPVKKGIVVADRVVKFVASFVAAVSPMGACFAVAFTSRATRAGGRVVVCLLADRCVRLSSFLSRQRRRG